MAVKNADLLPLFGELKALLEPYAGRYAVRRDEPGHYELWSEKDVVIDGRKRRDVFFAGLIVQKSYVGFYYMPVYVDTGLVDVFGPELLALLKGKSCFRVRELTPTLRRQIRDALKKGHSLYRSRGWV